MVRRIVHPPKYTTLIFPWMRGVNGTECMAEEGQPPGEVGESVQSKYSQIMRLKAVHALAIFSLIYVGVEVTLGGAKPSFLVHCNYVLM